MSLDYKAAHAKMLADMIARKKRELRMKAFKQRKARHTRSSFAWASMNKIVSRLVPMDLDSPDVPYQPVGPCIPLLTAMPVLAVKHLTEYWVLKIRGERAEVLQTGFTRCCAPDKECKRKKCAKCWALQQTPIRGYKLVVREVPCQKPKIVDPFGVDPHGKQSQGKDLDPDIKANFRLTSSQRHYRGTNSH